MTTQYGKRKYLEEESMRLDLGHFSTINIDNEIPYISMICQVFQNVNPGNERK
jgi:L-cysteine desulfidase